MSLKNNFIYSSILTVSKYLFPLIVYPYISRTLGLSNIGIVNFIDNIINYFVFVSMMGISTVGVREIAARKNNQDQLSKTFVSLLTLTAITTLIAIIALWVSMYTVPKLIPYQNLLYIGLVKLLFNFFLIEWFFTGMEEFKYHHTFHPGEMCLCAFCFRVGKRRFRLWHLLPAYCGNGSCQCNDQHHL